MTSLDSAHPAKLVLATLHDAVMNLLVTRPGGWTEHELIRHLSQPPYNVFETDCLRQPFSLFQAHFLLFHTLYLVRDQLEGQGEHSLEISALHIRLLPYRRNAEGVTTVDPLQDYYRNWDNLARTGPEDVEAMLENFWRKLTQPEQVDTDEIRQALATLELAPNSGYAKVKQQYRRLAMRHHPDRGGDAQRLQDINAAKLVLDCCFRKGALPD